MRCKYVPFYTNHDAEYEHDKLGENFKWHISEKIYLQAHSFGRCQQKPYLDLHGLQPRVALEYVSYGGDPDTGQEGNQPVTFRKLKGSTPSKHVTPRPVPITMGMSTWLTSGVPWEHRERGGKKRKRKKKVRINNRARQP